MERDNLETGVPCSKYSTSVEALSRSEDTTWLFLFILDGLKATFPTNTLVLNHPASHRIIMSSVMPKAHGPIQHFEREHSVLEGVALRL